MGVTKMERNRLAETFNGNYKYMPSDFEGMNHLAEELEAFYIALELYKGNITLENKVHLLTQRESLYFAIKHRHLEGFFNEVKREVLLEYLGGLLDD